jgi:hypothetical protein
VWQRDALAEGCDVDVAASVDCELAPAERRDVAEIGVSMYEVAIDREWNWPSTGCAALKERPSRSVGPF